MNNKLNLFSLIDRASRSSDLQWEEMLDTELDGYKKTFVEGLEQMSRDIRSRIAEDLAKNRRFYVPPEKRSSALSLRRLSISKQGSKASNISPSPLQR